MEQRRQTEWRNKRRLLHGIEWKEHKRLPSRVMALWRDLKCSIKRSAAARSFNLRGIDPGAGGHASALNRTQLDLTRVLHPHIERLPALTFHVTLFCVCVFAKIRFWKRMASVDNSTRMSICVYVLTDNVDEEWGSHNDPSPAAVRRHWHFVDFTVIVIVIVVGLSSRWTAVSHFVCVCVFSSVFYWNVFGTWLWRYLHVRPDGSDWPVHFWAVNSSGSFIRLLSI